MFAGMDALAFIRDRQSCRRQRYETVPDTPRRISGMTPDAGGLSAFPCSREGNPDAKAALLNPSDRYEETICGGNASAFAKSLP